MSNMPEEKTAAIKQRLDSLHEKLLLITLFCAFFALMGVMGIHVMFFGLSIGEPFLSLLSVPLIVAMAVGVSFTLTSLVHTACDIMIEKLKLDS